MHFENLQVDWERVYQAETVELKPLERDYLKVLYITWGISYGVLLLALVICMVFIDELRELPWLATSIGVFLLLVLSTYVIGIKSFNRKGYAIREKDLLYRTGWIVQKLQVVPFSRIQHCVIQTGPIERKYGLAGLSIHTAASDVHDISINGLKKEDAEQLKTFILQQIEPLV